MLQRPQIRRALRPGVDLAAQEHPGDSLSAHAPEAHDSPPRGLPSACALNFGGGESPPSGGMDFLAHARVPPSPPLPGGLNLGLPTNPSEEEPRVSASRTLFASYPTEGARTSCGREASVADEAVPAPTPEMPPPPPPASSHEPHPPHHHAEDIESPAVRAERLESLVASACPTMGGEIAGSETTAQALLTSPPEPIAPPASAPSAMHVHRRIDEQPPMRKRALPADAPPQAAPAPAPAPKPATSLLSHADLGPCQV